MIVLFNAANMVILKRGEFAKNSKSDVTSIFEINYKNGLRLLQIVPTNFTIRQRCNLKSYFSPKGSTILARYSGQYIFDIGIK